MVTSSADSIWRRFSSSAPQSRARRWLSTGSILTSTALLAIRGLASKRVGDYGGDAHVREAVDQPRIPREVDGAVIRRPTRQLACSSPGKTFHEHTLRGSDHGFARFAMLPVEQRLQALQPFA